MAASFDDLGIKIRSVTFCNPYLARGDKPYVITVGKTPSPLQTVHDRKGDVVTQIHEDYKSGELEIVVYVTNPLFPQEDIPWKKFRAIEAVIEYDALPSPKELDSSKAGQNGR